MRKLLNGVLFRVLILGILILPHWLARKEKTEPPHSPVVETIHLPTPPPQTEGNANPSNAPQDPREGEIELLPIHEPIDKNALRTALEKLEPASKAYTFTSNVSGDIVFVAEPSVKGKLYSPTAYLLGKAPFSVSQNWMPYYAVVEHMHYQLDSEQFAGRDEVWLTSMQAWNRTLGDCEDHAILLADWLMTLGLDARVALGTYKNDGHAWVIVLSDNKEYLLEATDKQKIRRWSAYPLAISLPDYHPQMMFNRDFLWVNTGSAYTVSYSTPAWKKAYQFRSL
jgi:hypothetical protein